MTDVAIIGVSVGGPSQAPVSIHSNSTVGVQDQAASAALSGQAWAVADGAAGSPSGVNAPNVATGVNAPNVGGAGSSSPNMSVVGLQVQNDLSDTQRNVVTSTGGRTNTAPISIAPSQTASVDARGVAAATSNPVCGGAACQSAAATAGGATADAATGNTTQAVSGAASSQGLAAANQVNTNAVVDVRVAGRNFAPVRVIVDSIAQIFNLGIGSSVSGDATAGGVPSSGGSAAGPTVASGTAQATGAQVANRVNLRSSAAVRVTGDNYNPINILLNLAATLFNRGVATATSGDAQAGGSGASGTALSGATSATGLQVMNIVNMWADANVDIEGNNYAPIVIDINFNTAIDNRGIGVATSGNAGAGKTGTSSPTHAAAPASGAANSGSTQQIGRAAGGDATAIANSMDASFTSAQLANANGGSSTSSAVMSQLLRRLPAGSWDPFIQNNIPETAAPAVSDGVSSTSGATWAEGLHAAVGESNAQVVACNDSDVSCRARNTAVLSATISDAANNPAVRGGPPNGTGNTGNTGGGPTAQSGDALLNATPTPVPSATRSSTPATSASTSARSPSGGGSGGGNHTRRIQLVSHTVAQDLAATGHVVLVDLWDRWPGRRLPPMPDSNDHKPLTTTVNVAATAWPGADELPLPDVDVTVAVPGSAHVARAPAQVRGAFRAAPSRDAQAGDDSDGPLDVLAITTVDPFGTWPSVELPPMPAQVLAAPTLPEVQPDAVQADAESVATETGGTGIPIEDAVAVALLALVAGGMSVSPRGRRALRKFAAKLHLGGSVA